MLLAEMHKRDAKCRGSALTLLTVKHSTAPTTGGLPARRTTSPWVTILAPSATRLKAVQVAPHHSRACSCTTPAHSMLIPAHDSRPRCTLGQDVGLSSGACMPAGVVCMTSTSARSATAALKPEEGVYSSRVVVRTQAWNRVRLAWRGLFQLNSVKSMLSECAMHKRLTLSEPLSLPQMCACLQNRRPQAKAEAWEAYRPA